MRLGLAIAAVVVLAAAPAHAALVIVTYRGVVTDGFDQTGTFGQPGDLAGAAFSARFLFDDAQDGRSLNFPLSSSFDYFSISDDAPVVSASIRINGRSFSLGCPGRHLDPCSLRHTNSAGAGGVWGVESSVDYFSVDPTIARVLSNEMSLGIASTSDPFVTSYDYRSGLSRTLQPGDVATGGLQIVDEIIPDDAPSFYRAFVTARLMPTSVTVALPEPATWALMILGFGAVGAALRRRAISAPAA